MSGRRTIWLASIVAAAAVALAAPPAVSAGPADDLIAVNAPAEGISEGQALLNSLRFNG